MQSPAKRQTVQFTTWVKPAVKHELHRRAKAAGLTVSRTGAAALEQWIAQQSHIEHRGIFQPMIEHAVAKEIRPLISRVVILLVRSLFSMEQTRGMVRNVLGRQPGVTESLLNQIIDRAGTDARHNLARKTPQLERLLKDIEAIEQWLLQDEAQPNGGK
jgi:hypothetical protein